MSNPTGDALAANAKGEDSKLTELLPCPFCGGRPRANLCDMGEGLQSSSVQCKCGAGVGKCDLTAVLMWNTRQHTPSASQQGERVDEATAIKLIEDAATVEHGTHGKSILISKRDAAFAYKALAPYLRTPQPAPQRVDEEWLRQALIDMPPPDYTGLDDYRENIIGLCKGACNRVTPAAVSAEAVERAVRAMKQVRALNGAFVDYEGMAKAALSALPSVAGAHNLPNDDEIKIMAEWSNMDAHRIKAMLGHMLQHRAKIAIDGGV